MARKIGVFAAILGAVLLCGIGRAQDPVLNVDKKHNPNLAEAQRLVAEANSWVVKAQKANNDDMKGHAEKARELLVRVNEELKAAADAADAAGAARSATPHATPQQKPPLPTGAGH